MRSSIPLRACVAALLLGACGPGSAPGADASSPPRGDGASPERDSATPVDPPPPGLEEEIARLDPAYERRSWVGGFGTRIVFDLDAVRVPSGSHVLARVRSRRFDAQPRLALSGPAGLPEPIHLGDGAIQGGFERRFLLPELPAGRIRVEYSRGDAETPTGRTTLFVFDDGGSLLENGSFEADEPTDPPAGWTRWDDTSGEHTAPSFGWEEGRKLRHGRRSVHFTSGWSTHDAGLFQRAALPADAAGCRIVASVQTRAWAQQEEDWTPERCGTGSFRVRLGVDPTGGTDALAETVVWDDNWEACPDFVRLRVEAPVEGDAATVFLRSSPMWPARLNRSWWDDARLELRCD